MACAPCLTKLVKHMCVDVLTLRGATAGLVQLAECMKNERAMTFHGAYMP